MRSRSFRLVASVLAVVVLASGCEYMNEVDQLVADGATEVPWYCNPTAPNSVTGPGMGTVDFYAGQTRAPLDWATCRRLAIQMDQAKAYAMKYPTAGAAWAAGFRTSFTWLPGMGTHTGFQTVTPELLADPGFDPLHPIIPGIMDDQFDPGQPEFLQYNGNGSDAKLIGMSWYVRTDTGMPPEGFPGANDWWHHHPRLCFRKTDAIIIGVNGSDSGCASSGGVNLHTENYYMVHLWVAPNYELEPDVFAPTHPCITAAGQFVSADDPCHGTSSGASTPSGAALRSVDGSTTSTGQFCPLGSVTLPEPSSTDPVTISTS